MQTENKHETNNSRNQVAHTTQTTSYEPDHDPSLSPTDKKNVGIRGWEDLCTNEITCRAASNVMIGYERLWEMKFDLIKMLITQQE